MQNAGQLFQALTYLLLRNRNRGESEAQAARKPALLNTSGTCRTVKLCIIQVTEWRRFSQNVTWAEKAGPACLRNFSRRDEKPGNNTSKRTSWTSDWCAVPWPIPGSDAGVSMSTLWALQAITSQKSGAWSSAAMRKSS